MKKILTVLVAILLAVPVALHAERDDAIRITGRVVDEHENPLPWAVVAVENSMIGTTTQSDGSFTLNLRKQGNYTITASFMGYGKASQIIAVVDNAQLLFTLHPQAIMGEEVVITSTRADSRMPIAQTTMDAEELEAQKNGFDIPYLLQLLPSVVSVSEGGTGLGNTSFRIRGTDMSRINVTVNGIPLNDPESQSVFWVNMPDFANSVDNVQVQRGVGTSTQGAGAFGATVNFQTTTLTPEPFASAEVMGGSFNTLKTSFKAGTGLINDRFSFETRYSKILSDGYIRGGWSDHQSLFFTGAWHTEKSLLRMNFIRGEQHTGITWEGTPGYMLQVDRRYNPAGYMGDDSEGNPLFYPNESDNYNQNHYHLIFSHQLNRSLWINATGFLITGDGYYEQYKRNRKLKEYGLEPFEVDGTTISKVDMIRNKGLDNHFYGGLLSLNYQHKSLKTQVGGGWNQYKNNHFGKVVWTEMNLGIPNDYEWYRNVGDKQDLNLFAKATYDLMKNLSLFGDVQLRTITHLLDGIDDDLQPLVQNHSWTFFNPKGGLYYTIAPGHDAFFSVATAHREPSRTDLKDAQKDEDDHTPLAERLLDYELGYTYRSQFFSLGLNLYYMDYKNQLVLTGELSESGYALTTNVDRSYRRGVELSGSALFTRWLRWDANLTLSQNHIQDYVHYVQQYDADWNDLGQKSYALGQTDISFSPSIVASSQLSIEPVKDFSLALVSKYVGKQFLDNSSDQTRMLDPYFVNDFKIGYRFKVQHTQAINVQLFVNNLFNTQYIANGWVWYAEFEDGSQYREDGFFPQAGINFMGRIALEF